MKQNYIVTKSNKLITSTYKLSLQEQRVILALVGLIDSKNQTELLKYEMSSSEFSELLGIENTNHTYLAKITRQLMTKVVEIEDDDEIIQANWLSSCKYNKGKGTVKLGLHEDLMPYLLQLKNQFTQYSLSSIIQMKSMNSIRIYEILKANQFKKHFEINIEELKKMLSVTNYDRFSNFNQKVLQPSIEEINKQSDLIIRHEVIKKGTKVTAIAFDIIGRTKFESELYGEA